VCKHFQVLVSLYDANRDGVLPAFTRSRYEFSVAENQPAGTSVGLVRSRGVNKPEYFLLAASAYLRVVPESGEILTRSMLDHEELNLHRYVWSLLLTYLGGSEEHGFELQSRRC